MHPSKVATVLIYLLHCRTTGKSYVGQTNKSSAEERFRSHIKAARGGKPQAICHAIRKYGEDNFTVTELQRYSTQEELDAAEEQWIARLNTLVPHGYNIATGGYGLGSLSPESREKIAASKRGVPRSAEVRAKMSASHRWKKLSAEHRERIGAAHRGRLKGLLAPEIAKKISGEKAPNAVLTWQRVREIRRLHAEGATQRALAALFEVSQMAINLVVNKKTWKEEYEERP